MPHRYYIINLQSQYVQYTDDPIVANEYRTVGYIVIDTTTNWAWDDGKLTYPTPVTGV